MYSASDNVILSSRILNAPAQKVYNAFAEPSHLARWWGPEGFTNTIHVFDLRPEGEWILTMHGPDKGHYENASVFKTVEPQKLVSWTRKSQPYFDMEIHFEELDTERTRISFRMIFDTAEACEKIRRFAEPKNEENFDRLERELDSIP